MKTKYVERVIYSARWLLLGGIVDYLASGHFGVLGAFTGWMAMGLGASGAIGCQWAGRTWLAVDALGLVSWQSISSSSRSSSTARCRTSLRPCPKPFGI